MEGLGGFGFGSTGGVAKKRRSSTSRRPQSCSHAFRNYIQWPNQPMHPSKEAGKGGKDFWKSDGVSVGGGCSEQGQNGVLALSAPARYGDSSNQEKVELETRSGYRDGDTEKSSGDQSVQAAEAANVSAENRLSKLKLKLGGVTRTVHAKSDVKSGSLGSLTRAMQSSDVTRPRQQRLCQGNPWKDISGSNFFCEAMENPMGKESEEIPGPVRKSKRAPKRRALYSTFDDHGNDGVRSFEMLRSSNLAASYVQPSGDDNEGSTKKLRISNISKTRKAVYSVDEDYGLPSRSANKNKNKSACGSEFNDTYYAEKEGEYSYSPEESDRKNQKKLSVDSIDSTLELPTTRRRSLQLGKDVSSSSLIEFPNGLPPAPPRKQKEKLSAEEQQLKKAEAARRRKMQSEKAAKESEARAIRKILGVDSDKKKAEKQRVHAEKAKDANSQSLSSCTVRLVMGRNGTVVTFPEGVELPSIFVSKPCSYPPPREICAGPSCTNSYKYRDSRSNLPLCSLQCYRAVQGSVPPMTTC